MDRNYNYLAPDFASNWVLRVGLTTYQDPLGGSQFLNWPSLRSNLFRQARVVSLDTTKLRTHPPRLQALAGRDELFFRASCICQFYCLILVS